MKVGSILPILALIGGSLGAQTQAAKPGIIEGTVNNAVTGEPVKKAVLTLPDAKRTAITDAAGHFRFDGVPPGVYWIAADRDGFEARNRGSRDRLPRITVAEEQHVVDVAVRLMPLATVSGHVLDEAGDPVIGAQIAVLRYFYGWGQKRLTQVGSAESNDLGEFEALNVAPGRCYLQVRAAAMQYVPQHTRWAHPEEAYPLTFYPSARDISQATAIDLEPGAHVTDIDFRLRKVPAYHVRGRVSYETDQRMIELRASNFAAPVTLTQLQSDGSFDLRGVPSGSYRVSHLVISSPEAFTEYQTVQVSDADVNGVTLLRKPAVEVSGSVTVEGSRLDKMDLQISLSSTQALSRVGNRSVGADGKLSLGRVFPRIYDVQIFNVPAGKYVKSIRFGDREINDGELNLTESPSAALNIVLGADGGEVNGNVQTASGQAAAAAQVALAPAAEEYDRRSDLLKRSVTDASGNFHIKDVAPGEYKAYAWESDPDGSSQSAEFRRPFENRSVPVTVGGNQETSVQLSVITAEDVKKGRSKLP